MAGEYHVLAQLAERGIVGALTLGHTKSVDILAHNPRTGRMLKIEVKTCRDRASWARLWHANKAYSWTMSEKHEKIDDPDLVYCFVRLAGPNSQPEVFVVPATDVAGYVTWEHRIWRESRTGPSPTENTMRRFRIEETDPGKYRDNWNVFE